MEKEVQKNKSKHGKERNKQIWNTERMKKKFERKKNRKNKISVKH